MKRYDARCRVSLTDFAASKFQELDIEFSAVDPQIGNNIWFTVGKSWGASTIRLTPGELDGVIDALNAIRTKHQQRGRA